MVVNDRLNKVIRFDESPLSRIALPFFTTATMRLSGDEEQPNVPGSSTEMTQLNASGELLVTKPRVYYGEGPFDPPSSEEDEDEDEERVNAARHDFEDDAETISLLSTTPLSPGRAERGGEMRSHPMDVRKVRPRRSIFDCHIVRLFVISEVHTCTYTWFDPHWISLSGCNHWCHRWFHVL